LSWQLLTIRRKWTKTEGETWKTMSRGWKQFRYRMSKPAAAMAWKRPDRRRTKATVRFNAVRHDFIAKQVLLSNLDEDLTEFESLRETTAGGSAASRPTRGPARGKDCALLLEAPPGLALRNRRKRNRVPPRLWRGWLRTATTCKAKP